MSTMNGYEPINDKIYDTATDKKSTIGAMTAETLDMQAETSAMLCRIIGMVLGEDCTVAPIKPSENLMSRLAAIRENQRDIMRAVKAIMETL